MGTRSRLIMLLAIVLSVCAAIFPYGGIVGYPTLLLSTFAHEMGHGIVAWLVGLRFNSLRLYADGSGVASISGSGGNLAHALSAAGGLIAPALASATLFYLAARPRWAQRGLWFFGGLLLLACVLVVRNLFGLVVVGAGGLLSLLVARGLRATTAQGITAVFSVTLAMSVFSRSEYLFTRTAVTASGRMPSDVGQLARLTSLPYWFWGFVCGAISLVVLIVGVVNFWRATR